MRDSTGGHCTGPTSATEKQIAAMWAKLLKVPASEVQTDQNFFAAGGDSMLIVQLMDRIYEAFEVQIHVTTLVELGDVGSLSSFIDEHVGRMTR
jgi:acyl carrier protein